MFYKWIVTEIWVGTEENFDHAKKVERSVTRETILQWKNAHMDAGEPHQAPIG